MSGFCGTIQLRDVLGLEPALVLALILDLIGMARMEVECTAGRSYSMATVWSTGPLGALNFSNILG